MRTPATLVLLSALCSTPMQASEPSAAALPEIAAELPGARHWGTATLRFLGMPVYDARVWSHAPIAHDGAAQRLAIEVRYARALSGARIARRSVDEMKRLGPVTEIQAERWLQAMTRLFPDVQAGDRITGVQRPGHSARFFVNGRAVGDVEDPEFARLFFGIWLSPRSSEPALRAQLIGATP